ncbi:M23 family metallopeptidase [Jeotgalibacillus salarius]|uniref:M23 family metallopeptidase n=1 Tax=Jeotgalibacillus salarius TaxID=546023 RepID=A0A4Y8LLN1_9BACL|nr:M23 family metallopeptidase [Jeotgalibacillus salarius]TFE02157.1 M23 family metallopeptidase [Jeotgalibacillus salarius]
MKTFLAATVSFLLLYSTAAAQEDRQALLNERLIYYSAYHHQGVPWYYLAAIDQFERNIQPLRHDMEKKEGSLALTIPEERWFGPLHPDQENLSPFFIEFFGGIGQDINGDGKADPNDPEDLFGSMADYINSYSSFKEAMNAYYDRKESVSQILTIAELYQHFNTLDLYTHFFPLQKDYLYSYRSTWGGKRGWGGRRMHEGTDLFAGYGTPVLATTFGKIEALGWNDYGGWRVGLRDIHNVYHYYAHLSSFKKGLEQGDIVKAGDLIGYVGSSGYGKEGTSGKFPPHLHYGMYIDNGKNQWAYDPFPSLRKWESS